MSEPIIDEIAEARKKLMEAGFRDFVNPWIVEAAKRIEKDGHWADYSAWESWMLERCESDGCHEPCREGYLCTNCTTADWWENLDVIVRSLLYSICCEISDFKKN